MDCFIGSCQLLVVWQSRAADQGLPKLFVRKACLFGEIYPGYYLLDWVNPGSQAGTILHHDHGRLKGGLVPNNAHVSQRQVADSLVDVLGQLGQLLC